MSAQSYSNLANSEFNGNIILNNGYIKFPDGSIQYNANGGSATGVFVDQNNTFEAGYTQTFNGPVNVTNYDNSTIIGNQLLSTNPIITNSVLLGTDIADGIENFNGTISIGNNSSFYTDTNTNGISIGTNSNLDNGSTNNISLGYSASSSGDNSISIGPNTESGTDSIALGSSASATGNNAIAIGNSTSATGNNAIAIGANINTGTDNIILLGNSSNYVKIQNYLEFANGSIQTIAYTQAGISIDSVSSSTTSWDFATYGLPNFNIILATNIPALLPNVYTGSYNLIPQSYNFIISSAVIQNTNVNAIFTATNPNAQTQPVNFNGLYASGINTIVNSNTGILSAIEPTDFGTAFFNNVDTNTTATISPYFPTLTGTCYLNITTTWNGTDYIVFTTYDFQEINMSSNTTFNIGFNSNNYSQQINVSYTGGNLTTPILLQLSIK